MTVPANAPRHASLLLLGFLWGALPAPAQEGFRLRPSLEVAEAYDDNLLFAASPRERDTVTRLSPGLDLGYRSASSTVVGRYSLDAESYAGHPALNTYLARQAASLDAGFASEGSWLLSATGAFIETHTPGELNVSTALEPGRVRAQRLSAGGTFAWRFGPRTEAVARYDFAQDALAGGPHGDTHVAAASLERRLSPRDGLTLGYSLRRYAFAGTQEAQAHVMTVGWARELTPQTHLRLRAGPRLGDGKTEPEIEASLVRGLPRGELALSYGQSQSRIVGQAGVASTEMVNLSLAQNLARTVRVSLTPGVFWARILGSAAVVYRWSAEIDWRLARWLSLDASQLWSRQQGSLLGGEEIAHNLVLVRLVAAPPPSSLTVPRPGLEPRPERIGEAP